MEEDLKRRDFDIKALVLELAQRNRDVGQLEFILEDPESVIITRIEDMSVLNYVYTVQSKDKAQSIFIKYSQEKAAAIDNENYPLARQELEYNCLSVLHSLTPGCVPQPYCLDTNIHMIAMEYLGDLKVLGSSLTQGEVDVSLAARIGTTLGSIHKATHRNIITHDRWQEYNVILKNDEMRDKILLYRFDCVTDEEHKESKVVPSVCSEYFQGCLREIKRRRIFDEIKELYYREDCFMHPDLHLYSLMSSNDRVVLIDFEFGSLGNHAFSLAFLGAFYMMSRLEAEGRDRRLSVHLADRIRQALKAMFTAFFDAFGHEIHALGPREAFISEMAAFMGQTMFTYPVATGIDILVKMTDDQKFESIKTGFKLMSNYKNITSVKDFIHFILPSETDH